MLVLFMTIQLFLPNSLKVELKPKIHLRIRQKKNLTARTEVSVPPKAAADASCLDAVWQFGGYPLQKRTVCPGSLWVHHAEMG